MVLRRFVSLNGHPSKLLSDNGTQLIAASKELTTITKIWIGRKLRNMESWKDCNGSSPQQMPHGKME